MFWSAQAICSVVLKLSCRFVRSGASALSPEQVVRPAGSVIPDVGNFVRNSLGYFERSSSLHEQLVLLTWSWMCRKANVRQMVFGRYRIQEATSLWESNCNGTCTYIQRDGWRVVYLASGNHVLICQEFQEWITTSVLYCSPSPMRAGGDLGLVLIWCPGFWLSLPWCSAAAVQ